MEFAKKTEGGADAVFKTILTNNSLLPIDSWCSGKDLFKCNEKDASKDVVLVSLLLTLNRD